MYYYLKLLHNQYEKNMTKLLKELRALLLITIFDYLLIIKENFQ